jgi:hypothetical protein
VVKRKAAAIDRRDVARLIDLPPGTSLGMRRFQRAGFIISDIDPMSEIVYPGTIFIISLRIKN